MTRTDTIANNLANADTTAFKKDLSIFQSTRGVDIYRVQDQPIPQAHVLAESGPFIGRMVNGSQFVRNYTDFSQGTLRQTDNPLDLAITGSDFFMVQAPAGVLYTRDGSFRREADGTLVTANGYPVLDLQNQAIVLPNGSVNVDREGNVFVDGGFVDQIRRVALPNPLAIQKVGDNLYRYSAPTGTGTGEIHQGFLEASNANSIMEIVRLIEAQRAYEASAKALQSQDSALQLAVTDVGRSR